MQLDHLAIVCADLDTGCAHVERTLGITLQPGGQHARFGTHNRLLRLGRGEYLEVIAPDPKAAPFEGPRWFNLDDAPHAPRMGNWIFRCENIENALKTAPKSVGRPLDLTRGDLAWQLTVPADGSLPFDGAWPTLIQWGQGVHPADRLDDQGIRLTALSVTHPNAEDFAPDLAARISDPRIAHHTGPFAITATFDTPLGRRTL